MAKGLEERDRHDFLKQIIMENYNNDENLFGCMSIGACMMALIAACLLLAMCSCRPTQKIVEVEKWQHDTTTVVDTVHIKDVVVQHDSIYITEYVTQLVKDSTQTNVAWKHYTYDEKGNVTSLTDYTSSTQHGTSSHTATESASTSVSEQSATHEEKGSHSESTGHSEVVQSKEQVKKGLTGWQRFVMGVGYAFLVLLVVGIMFGGMRLYGKWKKL